MPELTHKSILSRLRRLKYAILASLIFVTMFPALMFFTRQPVELGAILLDEAQILGRVLPSVTGNSSSYLSPNGAEQAVNLVIGGAADKAARIVLGGVTLTDNIASLQSPIVSRSYEAVLQDGTVLRVDLAGSLANRVPLMILVVLIAISVCCAVGFAIHKYVFKPWYEAEIEREISRQRMTDLVALTTDWFWEQDTQERFTLVTLGGDAKFTTPNFSGKRWRELKDVKVHYGGQHNSGYLNLLDEGFLIELLGVIPRFFRVRGRQIYTSNGAFQGFRGAASDVTLQVLQQRKLEAYRDHLTGEVDERTAELLFAKQEAEKASKAKSEFLSTLSHEIRTPMNSILGLIHLLKSTKSVSQKNSHLENLESSGQHLMRLLNDVLDMGKIESGKLELEYYAFRLSDMIDDVVKVMVDRARSKSLSLKASINPNTPEIVIGDQQRLTQILLNLVSNAIKFTDHGSITINVSASLMNKNSALIRFEVRDTGVGIKKEFQSLIFDDFSQADSSTSRKYGGTGLGLAIAKKLTNLMGGSIGVDSEPGDGSCFWLSLPLQSSPQGVASGEIEVVTSRRQSGRDVHDIRSSDANNPDPSVYQQLAGKNALIVEDNPMNRAVLERILSDAGMNVTLAVNGEQAVQICQKGPPIDVILMDLWMPEMNGFEATANIKRLEKFKDMPVICVSASLDENVMTSCRAAGFAAILSKPIMPNKLVSEVKAQLQMSVVEARQILCAEELLTPLLMYLSEGDVSALAYARQHEQIFRDCMGAFFDRFTSMLEAYEFETALIEVLQLRDSRQSSHHPEVTSVHE